MLEAALSTVTNMDKGFLFNVKNLIFEPKKMMSDYIGGKRKGILNPISFLIIAVSLYLLVDVFIESPQIERDRKITSAKMYEIGQEAGGFMKIYVKLIWILSIFLLSATTKLLFKKHNYAERLAISSFVIGQATLVALIGLVAFNWMLVVNPIAYLIIGLLVYQYFKKGKDKLLDFFFPIFCVLLFFIQLFVIMMLIGWLRM